MKKIKLFVMICVSFCLMTLATLGVFSAFQNEEYTLDGTLEYEITDALVNVFTSVYKANTPQTISEINQTIEEISTTNAIPANLTNVSANTLQSSGKTAQFVDDVSITFSEESTTYYLVVNIQNQAPAMNTWAVIDDNIELPENVSLYTNTVQTSITSDKKAIVYAFNIEEPSYQEKTFKSKIKIGIKDLADQDFNLKKLKIEGTTVSAANTDITGAVVIPEGIKTIKANGFQNCESIMAVVLPDSLTTINSYAFQNCTSLRNVRTGDKITSLGSYSFQNCEKLYDIKFSKGIKQLYSSTFENCLSLTNFIIPDGVRNLDYRVFRNCTSLKSIYFPATVSYAQSYSFENCTSLERVETESVDAWVRTNFYNEDSTNPLYYAKNLYCNGELVKDVVVPSSVTWIGARAFINCKHLETVTFEEGSKCTGFEMYAFQYCTSLKSIEIPSTVRTMSYASFSTCTSLKEVHISSIESWFMIDYKQLTGWGIGNPLSGPGELYLNGELVTEITIPETITEIKDYALLGCSSLETLKLHNNITSIGLGAFNGCTNLKNVYVPNLESIFNITYESSSSSSPLYYASNFYVNNELITELTVPDFVTHIPDYLFYYNNSFTEINLNNVKTIGKYAFFNNTRLTHVVYSEELTTIGDDAFYGCTGLTNIILPNSLTTIGNYCFKDCSNLEQITLSSSLQSIGTRSFENCTKLKTVNLTSIEAYLNTNYIDSNSNPKRSGTKLLLNGNPIKQLVIPETVTKIHYSAFESCEDIEEITISDSVTILDSYCFANCKNLKRVNISSISQLETISGYAFQYCSKLETINLPNSINTISNSAFNSCVKLQNINIPSKIISLGEKSFYNCKSLQSVNIPEIENSATFSTDAFSSCSIDTVNISSVEALLKINFTSASANPLAYAKNMFINNELITEIVVPETITTINKYAFYNIKSLLSITIHSNVTSIDSTAFYNCSKLVHIKDLRTTGASSSNFPTNTDMEYSTEGNFSNNLQVEDNYYTYTIKDSEGNITKKYLIGLVNYSTTKIDNLETYNITDIYPYAFYNNKSITELTIGNTVSNIGSYAFSGCSNIIRIKDQRTSPNTTNLPSNTGCEYITTGEFNSTYQTEGNYYTFVNGNVKYLMGLVDASVSTINDLDTYGITAIYPYAFYNNKSLQTITIPNTVTRINSYAFYGCINLESIVFEDNSQCSYIGEYSFYECESLESISIPEGVQTINGYTFYNCKSLTTISIPTTLTYIYSYAFSNCSSLQNVDISSLEAWLKIGFSSSYGYLSHVKNFKLNGEIITSVVIPETITEIKYYAFYSNKNIISVTIPNTVTKINDYAFGYCTSLKFINIPQSIKQINYCAFAGCTAMDRIEIDSLESWLQISFGSSSNPINGSAGLYINDEIVTEVTIPENITEIKSRAFVNYKHLVSVIIPSHVNFIRENAFSGCVNLETINISEGLTSIGSYAFYNCSSLTQITIPNSVTSFGTYVFGNCTVLTQITLPNFITTLSNYLFQGCTSLEEIDIPQSVTTIGKYVFSNCTSLEDVNITGTVESFGDYCFDGCTGLINFNIPDTVTTLGNYVFSNCTSLESVNLSEGVTKIPDFAFYKCSSLKSIDIPEGVTSIGKYAFEYCTSLKDITFPSTLKNVGSYAFWECSGVKTVNAASLESWLNIKFEDLLTTPLRSANGLYINGELVVNVKIPKSITTLNAHAFQYCKSLQSITIHSQITSIPYATFYGCSNLREVIFEEGSQLVNMGSYVFDGCSKLKKFITPVGVKSVENSSFSSCGINTVVLTGVESIKNYVFNWSSIETVYISKNLKEIGQDSFDYARSMKTIYYEGTEEEFNKISINSDGNWYFTSAQVIYNYNEWRLKETLIKPTCTADGLGKYVSIWGEEKEEVLPMHHKVDDDGKCSVCGITACNINFISSDYGFVNDGFGHYVSNNRYKNSSTASAQITAVSNVQFVIRYNIDTEGGFDKFTITVNGTAVSNANGVSGLKKGEVSISLNRGDIVVISYVKDDTVSCIGDFVSFSIAS